MTWLNCSRRADLERYLRVNNVPVIYGVGGSVCTTLEAVNAALGVSAANQTNIIDSVDFA